VDQLINFMSSILANKSLVIWRSKLLTYRTYDVPSIDVPSIDVPSIDRDIIAGSLVAAKTSILNHFHVFDTGQIIYLDGTAPSNFRRRNLVTTTNCPEKEQEEPKKG
jgi:hypothetical protein